VDLVSEGQIYLTGFGPLGAGQRTPRSQHFAGDDQALLESDGLGKAMDLLKWELQISDRERILPVIFELAKKAEHEHAIKIRHIRKRDLAKEVRRFMEVYNSTWEKNWGFVPLTEAEVEHFAEELAASAARSAARSRALPQSTRVPRSRAASPRCPDTTAATSRSRRGASAWAVTRSGSTDRR